MVPFFSISRLDFVEMFVRSGLRRAFVVRNVRDRRRRTRPASGHRTRSTRSAAMRGHAGLVAATTSSEQNVEPADGQRWTAARAAPAFDLVSPATNRPDVLRSTSASMRPGAARPPGRGPLARQSAGARQIHARANAQGHDRPGRGPRSSARQPGFSGGTWRTGER